ncbi:MAG: HAD family phosphatase [Candidatus Eremiobacteraeota bacterium]|nr:HAD family phosphatase [Candidatus Eremiobacteraeota bacterium]
MPTIDLIALDLDGTLLNSDEHVSLRNTRAIQRALESGIRVVLVTGRGVDMPVRISRELGLNLPVICCHGALTKDFGSNRTLVHIPVPLAYAKTMIEYAETHHLQVAVYVEEFFYRLTGSTIYMADMTGPAWKEVASFRELLTEAPTFIRFLGTEAVEALDREFSTFPLNYRYETWGSFVECAVLSRDAGKKQALVRLAADFQIPRERVLAIGDSRNDVPMLQWAGIGVAMGNALPEVKQAVPVVTAGHDQDGVALAIERFALDSPLPKKKQRFA